MDKYTFFYTGPFSQWHRCKFRSQGREFNCAEQFMMYEKALLFDDEETAEQIMLAVHPKEQKILGRQVRRFDQFEWDTSCLNIVYRGNYFKFTQNVSLLATLYETAGTTLVEASPTDTVWGIGLSIIDEDRLDPAKWRGTNFLGKTLTSLRDNLLEGRIWTHWATG